MMDSIRFRRFALGLCALVGTSAFVSAQRSTADEGSGLTASYFNGITLQGAAIATGVVPTVNFDWQRSAPVAGVPNNLFSARYSGDVVATSSGEYTFFVTADDGVRLSVGGATVLNDWTDHPAREARGVVTLAKGQRVPLTLEYYERQGRASPRMEWSGPGVTRQVVPTAQLFPTNQPTPTTVGVPTTVPPTTAISTTIAPTTIAPTTLPSNSANTFYVATNGDNTNPGTAQKPWRTIQHAATKVTPGQTVLVASGTYENGVTIERSGKPGQMITFQAAPGASPKIRVTTPNEYGVAVLGSAYIRVEGFEIAYEGPDASGMKDGVYGTGMDAVVAGGVPSHHIEFVGNNVHDFPGQGVGALQADYVLIEGNTIWNNSKWNPYQTSGISLYQTANVDFAPGFHNVIRGNVVYSNENNVPNPESKMITDGNCIIIDDQRRQQKILENKLPIGPYESDTLVENNICAGNGGRGVHVFNSDNVLVRNNTLYYNGRTEVLSGDGELNAAWYYDTEAPNQTLARQAPVRRGNVRFVNNLVVSDRPGAKYGTNDDRDRNNATFERNYYVGTKPLAADGYGILKSSGADDIIGTTDPMISPSQGDFRLRPGSAPIDAGRPDGAPPFDQTGFGRPYGSAPDIGALEWRP